MADALNCTDFKHTARPRVDCLEDNVGSGEISAWEYVGIDEIGDIGPRVMDLVRASTKTLKGN